MTVISPEFNVSNYELYGYSDPYLSTEQTQALTLTENRVNAQLDWLGQMLGWSGNEYWFNLISNVNQKRQLLGGSFGVYNSYVYPVVVEFRNWDNTIVLEKDDNIKIGQSLFVVDTEYTIQSVVKEGDNLVISIGEFTSDFTIDIAANAQVKIAIPSLRPFPFERPTPGVSADASFSVQLVDGPPKSITLYPGFDKNYTLPYIYNVFYAGSRLFFDKPVRLITSEGTSLDPVYDFDRESWYINIPVDVVEGDIGTTVELLYGEYTSQFLIVPWDFSSDWGCKSVLDNFTGVWGNKGGFLPFNFVFDSLSLHGFDEGKSLYLAPVENSIPFNDLLNFVYYQKAPITTTPPSSANREVWWNNQTGRFSIFPNGHLNCGPWVEVFYPNSPDDPVIPDYVFPDYTSFSTYIGAFLKGKVVKIINGMGLSDTDKVIGLTGEITSECAILMFKPEDEPYWQILEMSFSDELAFNSNAQKLPGKCVIRLEDATSLSPSSGSYTVENLYVTLTEPYPVMLSRWDNKPKTPWYVAPPSNLKYIGNTRLFGESIQDGELYWDYSNSNLETRPAFIYYYNRWEYNVDHWELQGDWVGLNGGSLTTPPPAVLNFDVLNIYCNGTLVEPSVAYQTYDFRFSYDINTTSGKFEFSYTALTFEGTVNLPKIEISDNITTTFNYEITDLVFSGIELYFAPNVRDSSTPLRIWKTKPLYVVSSRSDFDLYDNVSVAGVNAGTADENWENYFLRLPPSYQRDGAEWKKVNLICQDFALWGSPISPENMICPPQKEKPRIYEEVVLNGGDPSDASYLYSEPYLYSNISYRGGLDDPYLNADVIPVSSHSKRGFTGAKVITFDPLHDRKVVFRSSKYKDYGDWAGDYYRAGECQELSGFLANDLENKSLEGIEAPVWDSSVYKYPTTCVLDLESSKVDANHFKIGYAYFVAGLSAAGEAFFDPFNPTSWRKCTGKTSLYWTGCQDCPENPI